MLAPWRKRTKDPAFWCTVRAVFFFALEVLMDSIERRLFHRWCIRSENHRKM